tara:strand:+ start:424 stop:798 length:375 start_codon:yes stop_codon:yes gene_type:complete
MNIQNEILKIINKIKYEEKKEFENGMCLIAHYKDFNFTFSAILKQSGQLYLHREPPEVIRNGKLNLWKIENKTVPEGSVLLTLRYSYYLSSEQYYNIFLKEKYDFKENIKSVKEYFETISLIKN